MTELECFSLSDRGRRQNNEDFTAFYEPTDPVERAEKGCLYIVADGVGGAARGERASQFAAQKVLYDYYQQPFNADPSEHLRLIMQKVNEDIHSHAESNGVRMATTIVAVVIRNGLLHLANVGDSRAYLIRGDQCRQLSRDHSIVGEMVATGEMTELEAMASKVKNRLTRSLGGESEVHVDIYPPLALDPGDRVLLCTDGLTRYAARDDINRLTAQGSLPEIGQRLVQFANARGGADNVSVVLICYKGAAAIASPLPVPQPAGIDLDTEPTQPDFLLVSPAHRGRPVALVALSALAVVILSAAAVSIARNWSASKAVVPGIVPSPTATLATTVLATPDPSGSTQPVSPASVPSDMPTASVTLSPSTAPTMAGTVVSPADQFVCVRKVEEGSQLGTLSGVIVATGGKYRFSQPYFQCILDGAQGSCQQLMQIKNPPAVVAPNMWIVVPEVDQEMCVSKGGKWVLGTLPSP